MPTYEHVCSACSGLTFVSKNSSETTCPLGHRQVRRVYGFQAFHREVGGHFNHSVGSYVSNPRELKDKLKQGSDEQSEKLGMEHRFVMGDTRDKDLFPVPHAAGEPE